LANFYKVKKSKKYYIVIVGLKCGDAISSLHHFEDYVRNHKERNRLLERHTDLAQLTRLFTEKQKVKVTTMEVPYSHFLGQLLFPYPSEAMKIKTFAAK